MARYGTNQSIILIDSTSAYVDYTVYSNSSLIFAGRAYKFPDATNIKIDVTDICHALVNPCYLNSESGSISYSGTSTYVQVFGTNTQSFDLYYFNDYSTVIPQGQYLGNQISTGYLDPNSWLYPFGSSGYAVYKNGQVWISSTQRTSKIDLSNYSLNNGDVLEIRVGSETLRYVVKCGADYELYVQSSRGAIDTIPCYGPSTKAVSSSRYQIMHSGAYGPSLNYEHRNENKVSENKIRWNLVTGMTKDSEKIQELVCSNKAWLRDMNTNTLYAVNIVTSDIEQKLRKKDRNTSYAINVELARTVKNNG